MHAFYMFILMNKWSVQCQEDDTCIATCSMSELVKESSKSEFPQWYFKTKKPTNFPNKTELLPPNI